MKITYSDYTKIYENYLKLGEQFAEQANDANFNAKAYLTEKLNAFKTLENPTREDQLQLLTEYIGIKNIVGESVMEKDDATLEAFENDMKEMEQSLSTALDLEAPYFPYMVQAIDEPDLSAKLPADEATAFNPAETWEQVMQEKQASAEHPEQDTIALEDEYNILQGDLVADRKEEIRREMETERQIAINNAFDAQHANEQRVQHVRYNIPLTNDLFEDVYLARRVQANNTAENLENAFNEKNAQREECSRTAQEIDQRIANGQYNAEQEKIADLHNTSVAREICAGKIAAYTKMQEVRNGRSGWDKFFHPIRTFQEWRSSKRMEADLKENYNLSPDNLKKIAEMTNTENTMRDAGFLDRNTNEQLHRHVRDSELDTAYEQKFGKEVEEEQLNLNAELGPQSMNELGLDGQNLSQPVSQKENPELNINAPKQGNQ